MCFFSFVFNVVLDVQLSFEWVRSVPPSLDEPILEGWHLVIEVGGLVVVVGPHGRPRPQLVEVPRHLCGRRSSRQLVNVARVEVVDAAKPASFSAVMLSTRFTTV